MTITTWNFPTSIRFGVGAIKLAPDLCRELGITHPLLITDQGLVSEPFINKIVERNNQSGLATEVFAQVQGNPIGANVDAGVVEFNAGNHDGVIAVGGGSSLDAAKSVALVARQKESLWVLGGEAFDWSHIPAEAIVPLIAVPTTAGTGAEVGRSSVIIHEPTQSKKMVFHPMMMPPVVISDPQLTCGLPPHITAATGVDAFVHCFEAYCARGYHPMADGIALEGMRLVAHALPRAYAKGDDLEARGEMLTAATMGAVAFQKDLGAVHALAHPIGALYNIHHGLANAVLLPYVIVANQEVIAERMKLLGRILDLPRADFAAVLQWAVGFREKLGIPHTLADAGVLNADIDEIGRRAASDPCAPGNPIQFSAQEYAQIFADAIEGNLKVGSD